MSISNFKNLFEGDSWRFKSNICLRFTDYLGDRRKRFLEEYILVDE